MKTTKEPQRAWLYARVPGNYVESKNTLNVLMLQAQRDGAEVVGWDMTFTTAGCAALLTAG